MKESIKLSPNVCAMPDEKHDNVHIEIELPGVNKEDITLKMHDDSFTIRGKRGDVEYVGSYALCCPIEFEKAKSKYVNGLLTIDVPYKKPQMRGKQIKIE